VEAVEREQHAVGLSAKDEWHDQPALGLYAKPSGAVLIESRLFHLVVEAAHMVCAHRVACDRVGEREPLADQLRGQLARAGRDQQALALLELDQESLRRHQCSPALGDQLEDHVYVGLCADCARKLCRGLQGGDRALQLVASFHRARVAASVVECHARELGQHTERLLVGLRELLSACLLGQVEVPEGRTVDQDRHA
jgi:hypothetical protein